MWQVHVITAQGAVWIAATTLHELTEGVALGLLPGRYHVWAGDHELQHGLSGNTRLDPHAVFFVLEADDTPLYTFRVLPTRVRRLTGEGYCDRRLCHCNTPPYHPH